MNTDNNRPSKAWGRWSPGLLIFSIVSIMVLAKVFGLAGRLGALRDWIQALGSWGPAVFFFLYIAGIVAALPGSALTVAAGALFGSLLGIVLVSAASTMGAALAFLISRYFAREAVVRSLGKNQRFKRLDHLTERHGAVMVALTRLVPIFPFNLLNYGFGLTRVPFKTYLFWSWVCMLPGTILYVVGADAVFRTVSEGRLPWPLIASLAAIGVVLFFLVRYARRQLRKRESHNAPG